MSHFGKTLRRLRIAREMSLQDVASAAGITKTHVWDLERGRSVNPSIKTICGLAKALKVMAGDLCSASIIDYRQPLSIAACDSLREATYS